MHEFNNLLKGLLKSSLITKSLQVPKQQGAYILWLKNEPPVCLKVGIAGERKGKGMQERIQFHYSSNLTNSVLAEHMEADFEFGQVQGYDFKDKKQRQHFLTDKCFFQVIALPSWKRKDIERFEKLLEFQLKPRYKGRIKRN